eukprot:TRINITY_DN4151_c0_g1_i1.p2 TRINITY_DN4151_c0_g1~~TRINITY_DN4151_c0_g1_i1.p2  ORF type:complete len:51 (-),score=5.20 TRINITY_DN4151_c0_g1_i1:115-267(-)
MDEFLEITEHSKEPWGNSENSPNRTRYPGSGGCFPQKKSEHKLDWKILYY